MRVHFPADQMEQHDAHIIVQNVSETDIAVHLGFLQMNHHYEVKFSIKDELSEELITDPLQNIYAKVISVMPSEDGQCRCVLVWVLLRWRGFGLLSGCDVFCIVQ